MKRTKRAAALLIAAVTAITSLFSGAAAAEIQPAAGSGFIQAHCRMHQALAQAPHGCGDIKQVRVAPSSGL